ncbi:MAG: SDR family NAD(P)-dependent oxidoreductase [Xanthobacteraceae bacterium]
MKGNARPLALVTGASSGIGRHLARELARDGHDLVLTARRTAPMQALADELKAHGSTTTILAADLSKCGAAADLAREIETRGLAIDVLINAAGLGDNTGALNKLVAISGRLSPSSVSLPIGSYLMSRSGST